MADQITEIDALMRKFEALADERNQALERVGDAILRLAELRSQPDWPGETGDGSSVEFKLLERQGQLALSEAQERFRVTHLRCTSESLQLLRISGCTIGYRPREG